MAQLDEQLESIQSIKLDNAFYVEDGTWIESLTIASDEPFDPGALIDELSGVSMFHTRSIPADSTGSDIRRVTILANEPFPFVLGLILRQEVIPNRIVLQGGNFEVVTTTRDWDQFRSLADEIQEKLGEFNLISVTQNEQPGEPLDSGRLTEVLVSKLTDDQLALLEIAYKEGFFEVPREISATELAAELDLAQSTVSERLRTAERELLEIIYGPREE